MEVTVRLRIPKLFKIRNRGVIGNPLFAPPLKFATVFVKGNQYAKAENMSPESHARRMAGLRKTWDIYKRRSRGERVPMPVRQKHKMRHKKRVRLFAKVAKAAREIQDMARVNAEAAMQKCVDLMHDPAATPMVQLAACQAVLERGYGKPNQTNTNLNIDANGKENEVTSAELDERTAAALKRIEELTGGAPKKKARTRLPPDLRKRDGNPGGTGTVH